jgi:hypothetical protein
VGGVENIAAGPVFLFNPNKSSPMYALVVLWLPILLSAVFIFLASFILHMALPWHRNDYARLPNEDRVMDALRPFGIPPGDYMAPACKSPAEMKSAEFAEKMQKGPVMVLTVMPPGPVRMGKSLALWFIYLIVVCVFAAYIAGHAVGFGGSDRAIFRFVGATAFLGFAPALWQMSIWYQRSWVTTLRATIDGAIYALIAAGTFCWLWPK